MLYLFIDLFISDGGHKSLFGKAQEFKWKRHYDKDMFR
jgi:hypothetical protein